MKMKRKKPSDITCALAAMLFAFCAATAMADEAIDLNNRGVTYCTNSDYDMAIADFDAVLQIYPKAIDAKRYIEPARQERGNLQIRDNTP
jgi:tetratricopeptide (TPR) repeat protein